MKNILKVLFCKDCFTRRIALQVTDNDQDLFAPYDVTMNIPTFFRKTNRMTGKTVLKDRAISSKRVHIERIIGLAKTYKILKEPLMLLKQN
jgi:hypothetical protein